MIPYTYKTVQSVDVNILDQLYLNNNPGIDGDIIVKGIVPTWTSRVNKLITYNPNVYDINNEDPFMFKGLELYNYGNSGFKYDSGSGLFVCTKTDNYVFEISAVFDTYDGQTKFYMDNGTDKYAFAPSIYIPGNVNQQFYQFSVSMPCVDGQIWTFKFFKWGAGGTLFTIPADINFGNPQCTLSITRL